MNVFLQGVSEAKRTVNMNLAGADSGQGGKQVYLDPELLKKVRVSPLTQR